jgi:N-methylhydantoinase A
MQSNGGVISWMEASRMPCRVVESGPAAGVIAAAHFGKLAGRKNLISFDVGGTTAKAGLIENGEVRQAAGQEVGAGINVSRLLQGGGYFIGAATVDLAEVGAGGGSIAWIDGGSVLKVGPRSAGADPGPIVYGLGGDDVTMTDANVLLGRIPGDYFLGGEMTLDVERAREAVTRKLAGPLGISVDEACAAVVEVANANMLKMLRIVSVEKGYDPGDFTMVAFGGNGAVHAAELAEDLGIHEVVVPPAPGLLSAQGLLVADVRYDFRQTHVASAVSDNMEDVERVFAALEQQGRDALKRYGLDEKSVAVTRSADMRYFHQAYEITVDMPCGALASASGSEIIEAFHRAHEKRYGRRDAAAEVEFVTLNLTAKGETSRPRYEPLPRGDGSGGGARKGPRKVYFRDAGRLDCEHYDRKLLRGGDTFAGPAIVEAADSTTVVPPGWTLTCDSIGNLVLTRNGGRS